MSLLPRALLVNDPLSPLGKLVVREEEAASDPYASFYTNTSVKLPNGLSTFITEADCRQHKSNGTAQQPVPQVLPPSSPEAQGAVAVPPKFKVGDLVRPTYSSHWDNGRVTKTEFDPHRACQVTYYVPEHSPHETFDEDTDLELVSPSKPTEDSEGWIAHDGGPRPVAAETIVVCRSRNGREWLIPDRADTWGENLWQTDPELPRWGDDIVAYRLVKQS